MAHPDNTFKALKGEEQFVERWQCKFGLHRWTKWSDPQAVSYYYIQIRKCSDCGCTTARRIPGLTSV